MNYHIL
jgi:sensor histidine kinase YesM